MIKNQKQVSITKEKLAEFQQAFDNLKKKEKEYDLLEYELWFNSFTAMIADLTMQLHEYNELKAGRFNYTPKSLTDIPRQLIAARLALGLSQKELGDKLGIQEQQIQRYEAGNYETASWVKIVQVAGILGLRFCFNPTQLDKLPIKLKYEFKIPDNISAEEIDNADDHVKKGRLWPIAA